MISEAVVLFMLISMLVILGIAGGVFAYVAFPHRGEQLPGAPWLGEALSKAVERMPTLDEHEEDTLVARQHDGERRTLV